MGLFIGASVLTILEIFDYLYEVCKILTIKHYQCHNAYKGKHLQG